MNFIKDREPAAVAAFFLATVQGLYGIAGAFGYRLAAGQWEAITAFLVLVLGFLVRGNVTSNATLAAKKAAAVISTSLLFVVFLVGCNASQIASAVDIADDVLKVAQVLCLADHAKQANVRAITVQDRCRTSEQLAPYVPVAQDPKLMLSTGPSCP